MGSSRDVLARLGPQRPRLPAGTRVPEHPAVAADSASVLLVRDTADGLQVWLMLRQRSMAFAGGMVAFPGGRVDEVDLVRPDPGRACAVRELAEETGVHLPEAALSAWARWVTPPTEPRRYDTRFYVAVCPEGAEPADVSGEADEAYWCTPAEALRRRETGELTMMTPTVAGLLELADHDDTGSLLRAAAEREVVAVRPVPQPDGDGWLLTYPEDP